MPIYALECVKCGEKFEVFSKFENRANQPCPHCGTTNAKPLISKLGKRFEITSPTYYEHLDRTPVLIESREHLKQECKKRGVWAKCLD